MVPCLKDQWERVWGLARNTLRIQAVGFLKRIGHCGISEERNWGGFSPAIVLCGVFHKTKGIWKDKVTEGLSIDRWLADGSYQCCHYRQCQSVRKDLMSVYLLLSGISNFMPQILVVLAQLWSFLIWIRVFFILVERNRYWNLLNFKVMFIRLNLS